MDRLPSANEKIRWGFLLSDEGVSEGFPGVSEGFQGFHRTQHKREYSRSCRRCTENQTLMACASPGEQAPIIILNRER